MRELRLSVVVWVASLLLGATGCGSRAKPSVHRAVGARPAATPDRPPEFMLTASLSGTVHAEGRPLAGAAIALELLLGARAVRLGQARTDPRGGFRFTRTPPGVGRLTVQAPGRASHQATLWIEDGPNVAPMLGLQRSAPISGRVQDDRGRPLRASIRASSPDGWGASARSGADGRFRLDGLSPGAYRLAVEAPDHVASVEPEVVAPQDQIQLRLVRYYEIRGRVTPARIAAVRLAGSGIWPTRLAPTAADGSFRFPRVPAGVYELAAHVETPPWAASEILAGLPVGPQSPAPVELALRPGGRVHGQVLDGAKAVAGAVLVLGQGPLSVLQNRVTSDVNGRFAFIPVAACDLRLNVWARGYLPIIEQTLQEVSAQPLRINLSRGASLKGSLADSSGGPVKGALVWVSFRGRGGAATGSAPGGQLGVTTGPVPPIPAAGTPFPLAPLTPGPGEVGPTPTTALSESNGAFTLLGLPAGELRVIADHPDFARASSEWIEMRPDTEPAPLLLTLVPASRLGGRILDGRGQPLGSTPVIVRSSTGEPGFTDSDRDGVYQFRGLSGRVTVVASRPGYAATARSLRLEAGRSYEVDLVLEQARGEVRGRVIDPLRLPVSGARINLRDGAGESLSTTSTDAGGAFDLQGVGSRNLILEVSHPGFVLVTRAVRAGQEVEIQLGRPAALAGRVLDRRSGAPIRRFSVTVEGGSLRRRIDVQDRDGRFSVPGLSPGRVNLQVDAEGYAVVIQPVRLPPAEGSSRPEWIDVSLEAAGRLEGELTDGAGTALVGAVVIVAGVRGNSSAGGTFRLERVPEGAHPVEVRLADGRRLRTDPVVVRGGETRSGLRLVAR